MRARRLWWQLFASYLWIPVAALLLIDLYSLHLISELYRDHLKSDLEARAWLCAKPVAELLSRDRTADVDALCKDLGRSTSTRFTVILPSGVVVGDSDENPADMDNHVTDHRQEIDQALAEGVGWSERDSATMREKMLYVAIAFPEGQRRQAVVRAAVPVTALNETLGAVRGQIVVAGLIGTALIALVSLWISRGISRPLEQIRAGAARFARGELDHRLPSVGSEEVRAVVEALNHMARQLSARIETIQRQQNEHEAMLSSMEEGVLAIDNRGVIISLNETCAALLGTDQEKARGRLVHEVIRKPDLLRFVESALASPSPVEGDIQLHGPEDRCLSAHGTALFDAERDKIGVLIVLHDISRLRHLENVRRDFVANVSHELRTPITSIKGFVETLLDGALDDRDNAVRFLGIMLRQVNRLDAIIGDLLSLSRIEKVAEEHLIELAPHAIREVLAAAAEMCAKKAADKQIRIEQVCPDDLTARINAPLLEQAVVNLIDNAVKYSGAGSTVRLSAFRDGPEVVIEVRDEGSGIDARHLPRIFERFYRVDKARSRELGGTGLGLAIVKHIILAHGGSVDVESTIGVGSSFSLRLPAAELVVAG
jgi:two-component system, OmpR family, phosphate regulon sensor histidine kinase PhoR